MIAASCCLLALCGLLTACRMAGENSAPLKQELAGGQAQALFAASPLATAVTTDEDTAVATGETTGRDTALATGVATDNDTAVATGEATSPTLRVLSFNVRTWTRDLDAGSDVFWRTRMEAMERMIEDLGPDVLCFQEMLFPATRYVPDGYRRVSGGVNISHPIFVRRGVKWQDHDVAVRWEACTVDGIRIINVHSSWDGEITARTVEQVNEQLTDCEMAVACGDWNVRLAALQKAGLQMESARVLLGIPEDDTFANFTRPESHGPIDHFFIRGLEAVSYRMITDPYGCSKMSDHYPIVLDIRK